MFDIDVVRDLANQVGNRVAREYPGIEPEDIVQEIITLSLEKRPSLDTDNRDYVASVLNRDAVNYANKERYDYILSSSQYLYRPKEVRALLEEFYFQESSHDVPTTKDDYLSAEIGRGTVYASLLDVQEAWKRLPPSHAKVLYQRFGAGEEVTDTKSVTRAIDALTRAMNIRVNRTEEAGTDQPHDIGGPGSRKALSNAQAQHATHAVFDGEFGMDSLDEYQAIRSRQSVPAGTYFNWEN